jgi:hypothetical protein
MVFGVILVRLVHLNNQVKNQFKELKEHLFKVIDDFIIRIRG